MSHPPVEPGSAVHSKSKPWHSNYPTPSTNAQVMTREELRTKILDSESAALAHVLVDLRRNDHEGGTIRGSINLPAQSLYSSIPALYKLFSNAEITQVIWYCGSSKGRGNRAAGWFADFIKDQGNEEMRSLVLEEGIKGWVRAGEEFITLMDNYEAEPWQI